MAQYSYIARVLIGFDQFLNAILGGSPDETFSARCWRKREKTPWKFFRIIVDTLFFWQKDLILGGHCQQAWVSEMTRAQLPRSYRDNPSDDSCVQEMLSDEAVAEPSVGTQQLSVAST